jgi:formylglycine-generating enzyme required for sulfatase activity
MARLAFILIAIAAIANAWQPSRREFEQAGVCARCHVVSVLEWGLSKHFKVQNNCTGCHGESRGHIVDERNNIKPDKIPHGEAIAGLCAGCHDTGCPKTKNKANCQQCHHYHALLNPSSGAQSKDTRLEELTARQEKAAALVKQADAQAAQQNWRGARDAYRSALMVAPAKAGIKEKLAVCERRLNPKLPGFEIVGKDVDAKTGLPKLVRVPEWDIEMVLVSGGEFDMGSDSMAGTKPVHTVRVEPYYLARREVTQAQWKALMGANPSVHQGTKFPDADRMPVEQVSFEDCGQYLEKLNAKVAGGGFRLPTEAEWEFAARAGAGTAPVESVAWFRVNSAVQPPSEQGYRQLEAFAPHPAGTKQPDRLGLFDIRGNVWEWCSSASKPYPYDATDGREAPAGGEMRVLRGGGYADSAAWLDPAFRHGERAGRRYGWNGLRIARSIP